MPHVYFILCGQHVKIGVAVQPERRLGELQVGAPSKLTLLGSVQTEHAEALERALHAIFDDYRSRGEWFHYTPHLQAKIADFLSGRASVLEALARARRLKEIDDLGVERRRLAERRYEKRREERLAERRALADSAQDKIDAMLATGRPARTPENGG